MDEYFRCADSHLFPTLGGAGGRGRNPSVGILPFLTFGTLYACTQKAPFDFSMWHDVCMKLLARLLLTPIPYFGTLIACKSWHALCFRTPQTATNRIEKPSAHNLT